ncbi:DinB family protein [Oryzobacter terrae]|uniref:DinB family protein n=1 Tax=Oryzobacter terrae TaxID=1620385 RepID=UPI00366AF603
MSTDLHPDPDRAVLLGALAAQRRHVLAQLEDLTDEQLRRPVLPSGWSCLGLVRHLTLSDERYWFGVVVAGEPLDFWPEGENGDWRVGPDEAAADVLTAYRTAIAHADEVVATRRLDEPPLTREDGWDADDFPDLRSVLVHVLVETSVHAGHLDAVREILDGRQHIVL